MAEHQFIQTNQLSSHFKSTKKLPIKAKLLGYEMILEDGNQINLTGVNTVNLKDF